MKIFSSMNSTAGQSTVEKLKLKDIGTELVITSSHKGTKENKGPGGPLADIFGYNVTYEGKPIIAFDVNSATGDVITSTVKIQSADLTAEFFSALFSNLSMGGVKSLGMETEASGSYPKGVFLIADKQFPQIVNGTHFTPDPETNNLDPNIVKKLEQLKPLSSLKYPGEGEDSFYLKKGIHHANDGYIYRLK